MPVPPGPIAGRSLRYVVLPPGTVRGGRNRLRLTTVVREAPIRLSSSRHSCRRWLAGSAARCPGSRWRWPRWRSRAGPGAADPHAAVRGRRRRRARDRPPLLSAAPLSPCTARVVIGAWRAPSSCRVTPSAKSASYCACPPRPGPCRRPCGSDPPARTGRGWTGVPAVAAVDAAPRPPRAPRRRLHRPPAKVLELHHRNIDRALELIALERSSATRSTAVWSWRDTCDPAARTRWRLPSRRCAPAG
jgi:hypothetical protein